MTDKLAEEIIKQFVVEVEGIDGIEYVSHELAIYCMQAYHEAKMRKEKIVESFERENQYVTDEDIEAYADGLARAESKKDFERGEWLGIKEGARAMRDGEIKPVSRIITANEQVYVEAGSYGLHIQVVIKSKTQKGRKF